MEADLEKIRVALRRLFLIGIKKPVQYERDKRNPIRVLMITERPFRGCGGVLMQKKYETKRSEVENATSAEQIVILVG